MSDNYKVISLIEQYDKNKCDILIPCRIIYGLIPVMPKTSIIFEETILKLIAIGINSPEYIAATLCLDEEFVLYILNILQESNLIDEYYKITEGGKSSIEAFENIEENKQNIDDVEYILIGFIQNMLDGKLCDYIAGEKLETYICSNKKINKKSNKKSKLFKIEHILEEKSKFNIDKYEYKHIISINKKYYREIPVLGNLDIDKLQAVPKNYNIEIDEKSVEEIYLHCQVEYINNQICITDGYGSIAEDYIRSLDDDWMKDFINKQSISESSTQLIKFKKYSNIEKYIIKINEYGNNETDNKKLFDGLNCKYIYSFMENVLGIILKGNNFNKSIKNYTSDDIKSKCSKIGFKVPEKYKFKCNKINLNDSFDNLISHIILLAENTDNKRIKELVKEYPDFILQMCELKKYRDNEAHGKKSKEKISDDLNKFISKENIFDIIKLLLPDLEVNDKEGSSIIKIDDKLKNSIIDVRLQLGNNLYERLPENVCDNLIKILLDNDDVISNIYNTYQQLLVNIISNHNFSNENIIKEDVLKKYQNIIDDKYYVLLSQTSSDYITKAANNSNSTLNGCLIVFMYMEKDGEISKFFDKNKDFINDVSKIIDERGHANTLNNDIPNKDELLKKLLKYIKYFMEEIYA